jgi:hypothetical protein
VDCKSGRQDGVISSAVEHCLHTAGVTCSIHVSPTKNTNGIKHLAEMLGAFFLAVRKRYGNGCLPSLTADAGAGLLVAASAINPRFWPVKPQQPAAAFAI